MYHNHLSNQLSSFIKICIAVFVFPNIANMQQIPTKVLTLIVTLPSSSPDFCFFQPQQNKISRSQAFHSIPTATSSNNITWVNKKPTSRPRPNLREGRHIPPPIPALSSALKHPTATSPLGYSYPTPSLRLPQSYNLKFILKSAFIMFWRQETFYVG